MNEWVKLEPGWYVCEDGRFVVQKWLAPLKKPDTPGWYAFHEFHKTRLGPYRTMREAKKAAISGKR